MSVSSEALLQYGDREHTRTDHFREIQDHLGFRDARPADSAALGSWLLDRALEHDKPMVLFHLACQWLLQEPWSDPASVWSSDWWRRPASAPRMKPIGG